MRLTTPPTTLLRQSRGDAFRLCHSGCAHEWGRLPNAVVDRGLYRRGTRGRCAWGVVVVRGLATSHIAHTHAHGNAGWQAMGAKQCSVYAGEWGGDFAHTHHGFVSSLASAPHDPDSGQAQQASEARHNDGPHRHRAVVASGSFAGCGMKGRHGHTETRQGMGVHGMHKCCLSEQCEGTDGTAT